MVGGSRAFSARRAGGVLPGSLWMPVGRRLCCCELPDVVSGNRVLSLSVETSIQTSFTMAVKVDGVSQDGTTTYIHNKVHNRTRTLTCAGVSVFHVSTVSHEPQVRHRPACPRAICTHTWLAFIPFPTAPSLTWPLAPPLPTPVICLGSSVPVPDRYFHVTAPHTHGNSGT